MLTKTEQNKEYFEGRFSSEFFFLGKESVQFLVLNKRNYLVFEKIKIFTSPQWGQIPGKRDGDGPSPRGFFAEK